MFIHNMILFLWIINRFGAFEALSTQITGGKGELTATQRVLCGLGAGVSEAILAVTPMETVKVKFINDQRLEKPRFKGFFHGTSIIIREQGYYNTILLSIYTIFLRYYNLWIIILK